MKAYLKNLSDEISIIAVNLADHFAKPLYDFTNAKSYSEYIEYPGSPISFDQL